MESRSRHPLLGLFVAVLACLLLVLATRTYGGVLLVTATIGSIFGVVMWGGFTLADPLLTLPETVESPGRLALISTLRIAGLYTLLLLLGAGIIYLAIGINLLKGWGLALPTYLVGFCFTTTIFGVKLTIELVESERSRTRAEAERLRQAEELETARQLQLGLLPVAPPELPNAVMAWSMATASEVGGDYFDVHVLPDGSVHGAIGDATGHGLKAGMVCVAVKGLFMTGHGNPKEELIRVGEGVRSLGLRSMSMAMAIWYLDGRKLRVASAGLPPPLLYHAAAGSVEALPLKAPPVGQLRSPNPPMLDLELEPSDLVLFYTDGLPECVGKDGKRLGYACVPEKFKALAPGGAKGVVEGLGHIAESWRQGQPLEDDISILVLQAR